MIAETANLATVRQVVKEAEIATLGRRVSSKCRAARAKTSMRRREQTTLIAGLMNCPSRKRRPASLNYSGEGEAEEVTE